MLEGELMGGKIWNAHPVTPSCKAGETADGYREVSDEVIRSGDVR